jgi:hypothetical protein
MARVSPTYAIGAVGAILIFAAQTAPEDATTHIAGWLAFLGVDRVPRFFSSAGIDLWVSLAGAVLLFPAAGYWWWRRRRGARNGESGPEAGPHAPVLQLLVNWTPIETPRLPAQTYRVLCLFHDLPLNMATSSIMPGYGTGALFGCEVINLSDEVLSDVEIVAKVQFCTVEPWQYGKRSGEIIAERLVTIEIPLLETGAAGIFGFYVLNADDYFVFIEFPAFASGYAPDRGAREMLVLNIGPDEPVMRLLPREGSPEVGPDQ